MVRARLHQTRRERPRAGQAIWHGGTARLPDPKPPGDRQATRPAFCRGGRRKGDREMRRIGAVLLLACALARGPAADFPQPGEWPCFRRDGGLLARSPARGRLSEPRIVWKQFVGALETELILERDQGIGKVTLPAGEAAPSDPKFAKARSA